LHYNTFVHRDAYHTMNFGFSILKSSSKISSFTCAGFFSSPIMLLPLHSFPHPALPLGSRCLLSRSISSTVLLRLDVSLAMSKRSQHTALCISLITSYSIVLASAVSIETVHLRSINLFSPWMFSLFPLVWYSISISCQRTVSAPYHYLPCLIISYTTDIWHGLSIAVLVKAVASNLRL